MAKPRVGPFSPLPGQALGKADPVYFEVTDPDDDIVKVFVSVQLESGVTEVVYDGSFTPRYVSGSSASDIADGQAFSVSRRGGWPPGTSVSFRICAVDSTGNVNDATLVLVINLDFSDPDNSHHIVTIGL